MSSFVSRSGWGARSPSGGRNAISAHPAGVAIHWEGPEMGPRDHSTCDDLMRSIQSYHMDNNGWSDIAYNLCVCTHGYIYEGRGKGVGSAANGTTQANNDYYAVCALVGENDAQPDVMISGIQDAAEMARSWGAANTVVGHRDLFNTACPGDSLYSHVVVGTFNAGSVPVNGGGSTPPPTSAAPKFPLPAGHYFGPKSGPPESHSGYYNNDDDKFRPWQQRMSDRGWEITVDGLYGPETDNVCTQFQQEKGLMVDGLIGNQTWGAAWTEPVT